MIENGIVAVGDISNVPVSFKQKTKANLKYHTFVEVLSILPERANESFSRGKEVWKKAVELGLKAGIVPHASYTMSPELLKLISGFSKAENQSLSFHNQESKQENEFYQTGGGGFAKVYKKLGIDLAAFTPTGKNSLESTAQYFPSESKSLLVHNTFSTQDDVRWAHDFSENIYWCFCPNANLYIEEALPDFEMFTNENAKITLGTDSLTSNWQLSILEEMKVIQEATDAISLNEIMKWGTLNGAEFLGMETEIGSFENGKTPGINLIENIDFKSHRLNSDSKIKKLI
jgi:cytosine/adenosine deaminase-related metal-dependent hydrolase